MVAYNLNLQRKSIKMEENEQYNKLINSIAVEKAGKLVSKGRELPMIMLVNSGSNDDTVST